MRVALVDDSELDLMINQKIIELTYNESRVESFENPDAFFNYLKGGEQPQLIISDMQMPRTSGLELASKYIREYGNSGAQLVLLTAFVDDAIQAEVEAVSGDIKLVEKPLNESVLRSIVSA